MTTGRQQAIPTKLRANRAAATRYESEAHMRVIGIAVLVIACCAIEDVEASNDEPRRTFDSKADLISLHYDHAPDKDDGHSAAADRTVLESSFGKQWIAAHVVPVSGAYGENKDSFNSKSDAVMEATWNDCGGWLSAHKDWDAAVNQLVERWRNTLRADGDVWVKEGGQSDLTADVVRKLKSAMPDLDATSRIHVVQHSNWNEQQTTDNDLAYTKKNTRYVRIRDANQYLNKLHGDARFVSSATAHPVFSTAWQAAFTYYDPNRRLDFSDTGELLHILGLGELDIEAFRQKYLAE